ncbi:MAG TPA: nucleotidyltransferase family protein [Terriglobia bacterium]|nr:nucleotidyltransferase family protein [Terriglobia bacterium]
MIAAIILSGGKSERMGSPKALLQFRGQSFLETILTSVTSSGLAPEIVVAGHHYDVISKSFPDLQIVFNPNHTLGMSTSVQAGIRALPEGLEGAAIFLVDHPMVDRQTIDLLIARLAPGRIVVPVHDGRRGHPVVFSAELFEEILALPPDQGLNTVVRRQPGRVIEVFVENAGVLRDIDTPEQFARLLGENQ